jgi:acyl-CoA reductase-like NAD-dependent aldehyde dehydrogenase
LEKKKKKKKKKTGAARDDGVSGPPSDDLSIRDPKNPRTIRCFDPSTRQFLGTVPAMSRDEVHAACGRARAAQEKWAQTTFRERRRVLRVLQDYILDNMDAIARASCRDSGKTMVDASLGEVLTTCEKIRWTLSSGEAALAPEYRSTSLVTAHKRARVEYHPLGVLGIIAPWNYPFHNVYGHIISALFAGDAVVIKVSEHTSWSAGYYRDIVHAALRALGHSTDLVQIVTGFGDTGAALVECADIDKIVFTGSAKVGKLVMRAASDRLCPVVLELGGKDAMVVFDDCDFAQIEHVSMRGTFQNAGQNCVGAERFFVQAGIYDRFCDTVAAQARGLRQGNPLGPAGSVDVGSMAMPGETDRIKALVDDAVARGARVLVGGKINASLPGQYFEPTILADVDNTMRISQEEVFGPVMSIFRFGSEEEAIEMVNNCPFGLGSSVFSLDTARADRVGKRIRAGMTNCNDFGVNYLVQSMPFGGVGESGFDRFAGIEGLRGCCLQKSVTTDRIPGVRTTIPPPLQYPMGSNAYPFARALIRTLYARGLAAKCRAVLGLITNGGRAKQDKVAAGGAAKKKD